MKRTRLLWVLPLLLTLTACGSSSDADKEKEVADKEVAEKDKALPICPQVAIVRELEIYKDYGQEKPAPDQLVASADMKGVDGTCEYKKIDKKYGINVVFDLNMVALRGPRMGGLHASLPFFVAVVDPSGTVLNKDQLTADIGFSSDNKPAEHAESLHVFIPLDKKDWPTGPNYQVLMGFQLTKEQLEAEINP